MGFLSKIGKGIKGAFKKVGKAIKSGLKSVGKFMDKIGIVGQIGLSLLLPGIGSALSGMWGSVVGGLQAYSGIGSSVINAAGGFLNTATRLATQAGNAFSSITEGVMGTVGETLKLGAKKLGLGNLASDMGFTKLGTNINSASLDSIQGQFGKITDVFAGNIKGIDPTGSYATARQDAMMSPEQRSFTQDIRSFEMTPEIEAERLADFDKVQEMYDTGTDSLMSRPAAVPLEEVEGNLISRAAGQPSATVKAEPKTYVDAAKESFIATKEKAKSQFKEFLEDPFGKTMEYGQQAAKEGFESAVKTGVTSTALKAIDVDMTPDVYQTSYGTYVPSIDYRPVETAPTSNLLNFMNQNQDFINTHPFGATAAVVENLYPQMLRKNQSYGG